MTDGEMFLAYLEGMIKGLGQTKRKEIRLETLEEVYEKLLELRCRAEREGWEFNGEKVN